MKTALVFAAGRGERLRPLTDKKPKALCEVHGVPLIETLVNQLINAQFERILINHAHLGSQIKRHFDTLGPLNAELIYLAEPPGALETAGAIIHALPYVQSDHLVTVSGDIHTDFNFEQLRGPRHYPAHIVLVPLQPDHAQGDFDLTAEGLVTNTPRMHLFGNIACFSVQAMRNRPLARYSIAPLLRGWASTQQLSGEIYRGVWFDTGTPERLARANRHAPLIRPRHHY